MDKLIFLILAIPILIFVLYLGGTAIMTGFKAKGANKKVDNNDNLPRDNNDNSVNDLKISDELIKLNELLKSGALSQEEFDKAKKKLLDN